MPKHVVYICNNEKMGEYKQKLDVDKKKGMIFLTVRQRAFTVGLHAHNSVTGRGQVAADRLYIAFGSEVVVHISGQSHARDSEGRYHEITRHIQSASEY
jgi:hypothetical protein